MEGLIPFLLHALKKQNGQKSYRGLRSRSEGSSRSYHQLLQEPDYPTEGSSHRRTQSEFQPASVEFLENRSRLELQSRSMKSSDRLPSMNRGGSKQSGPPSSYQGKSSVDNNVYLFR